MTNNAFNVFSSKVRRVHIKGSASKILTISAKREGNEAVRETQKIEREKKFWKVYVKKFTLNDS